MNLQSIHEKSKIQAQTKQTKSPLINLESNTKIINSLVEKQEENTSQSQGKGNLAANYSNILNSKDIEVFNNIANKLTNNSALGSTQKKKIILNKNASCEKIGCLIDNKNKEMEIFNKINNFSLKYSNGQSQNSNLNSSALLSQRSARKKIKANSFIGDSKSNSKNATPNKKNNLFMNLTKNNNNNNDNNNNNNNNYSLNSNNNSISNNNNNNFNNISNASFNNSLLQHGLNNVNNNNYNHINENLSKFQNSNHHHIDLSPSKNIKTSDLANQNLYPHKISKIPFNHSEDFENCVVSDEEDHLPQAPFGATLHQLSRSIVLKPKPPLELNNYLSKELSGKAVIEEESGAESYTVIEGEFKSAPVGKTAFYESKKNLLDCDLDKENNALDGNANSNAYVDAERNNKELLKALTNMEQEINKSEFNNVIHSKSLISNNGMAY